LFSIQHLVGDEGARTLWFDLDQAIQGITASQGRDNPNLLKLTGVDHNLLRRWAMP
jgi:PKHD-type hydroxylase